MTTLLLGALLAGMVLAQSPAPDLKASMIVLGVSDVARSIKFYRDTLALPLSPSPGDLPIFKAGDLTIVLNGGMAPGKNGFEIVFPVESVAKMRKLLVDRGVPFADGAKGEAREVAPNLWAATFHDPDGHNLTLFGAR